MEIIAKTTGGVLINASESEVKEILNAVNGEKPKEINIGQKIPAIDYASTITKIKALSGEYSYRQMIEYFQTFSKEINELTKVIEATKNISI